MSLLTHVTKGLNMAPMVSCVCWCIQHSILKVGNFFVLPLQEQSTVVVCWWSLSSAAGGGGGAELNNESSNVSDIPQDSLLSDVCTSPQRHFGQGTAFYHSERCLWQYH